MFGKLKLDNTPLTCNQGEFNQIVAQSWNQILVTKVKDVHYHCATSTPFTDFVLHD